MALMKHQRSASHHDKQILHILTVSCYKRMSMRIFLIMFLIVGFLQADYDEKGMKVYKKYCKSCHGSGDYGAKQLDQAEWEDYFLFHAQKLKKAHLTEAAVLKKLNAFSKNKMQHLEKFLLGNAKDSGSVGGCDGNRCGIHSGKVEIKK